MEAAISRDDGALRHFPLERLGSPWAGALQEPGVVVTSACRLPHGPPDGMREVALAIGDRREVLLGASAPIRDLSPGTPVAVRDQRVRALLRAHHPGLRAVPETGDDRSAVSGATASPGNDGAPRAPVIRPLWEDPTLETRGEVLEAESWLPTPGQGIAVALVPLDRPEPAGVEEDLHARAVLTAERALAGAFPGTVVTVRARVFAPGLRMSAVLFSPDAFRAVRAQAQGPLDSPGALAKALASLLDRRGARFLIPSRT